MLDAFFAASPAGLAIFDKNLRYERINDTLARMNCVPPAMHLHKTIEEVLGTVASSIRPRVESVFSTGKPVLNAETSAEHPGHSGNLRHWVASYFPITNADGRVERVGAIVLDITRRKEAEEALRHSEQTLRLLSNRLLNLQDEERRRIARELHDSIGQCLVAIRMNLEIVKKNVGDVPEKVTKALGESQLRTSI
jgi:signal transduction histidine kinase